MNNYKVRAFLSIFAVGSFITLFFLDPQRVISGVSEGLRICATAVIPSLFPFIVMADFLVRSELCTFVGNFLSPVTRFLFRLPGSAGCAVLMSMIGGYPVGAKMTANLLEKGDISVNQSRRMMLFCINAGPAFVVGTVGEIIFSSRRAGVILYIAMIVSSLLMGFVLRFFDKSSVELKRKNTTFCGGVISESVAESLNTTLRLCAWILVFSFLNPMIEYLLAGRVDVTWIKMLTEVTGGCISAAEELPVSVQAIVMGWAGLSVHCQIMTCIRQTGLRYGYFAVSRLIHGILATIVAQLLFRLFPCETDVFSTATGVMPELYSVSIPASVSMLLLAMIFITDLSFRQTKKYNDEA
ncbi:MAG: hypothetical protein UH249_00365 [Acutalibacteraceae bacterium]|nr:hypothetical protein [Acutalibacteraceae bacterium]